MALLLRSASPRHAGSAGFGFSFLDACFPRSSPPAGLLGAGAWIRGFVVLTVPGLPGFAFSALFNVAPALAKLLIVALGSVGVRRSIQ